jgi:hypothetical protein
MGLIDAVADGRGGVQLAGSIPTIVFGAVLATYFFALVRFKVKHPQRVLEGGR